MSSTTVSIVSTAATDLGLRVALADEPRPLAVLPALVILRAAAAAEQRAHPRHVARVPSHVYRCDLECLQFYSC